MTNVNRHSPHSLHQTPRQDPVERKKNEALKVDDKKVGDAKGIEKQHEAKADAKVQEAKSTPESRERAARELQEPIRTAGDDESTQPRGLRPRSGLGGSARSNECAPEPTRTTSGEGRTSTDAQPAPAIVSQLPPAQRATLESTYAGTHGARTRDAVNGLIESQGFRNLEPDLQRRTLGSITEPAGRSFTLSNGTQFQAPVNGPELARRADEARQLVESRAMRDGTPPQRRAVVETFEQADPAGRTAMLALANPANNAASPLLARDTHGGAMIDSLHALATQPLAPALEPQRRQLVSSTIQEIQDPARTINQDNRGTCAATTVQYDVARNMPAEYARITAGLASPAGSVQLANGETMNRVADSTAPDDSLRSPSERLMQSAFMDFANGTLEYRNNAGGSGTATETQNGRDGSFTADGQREAGLMMGETRRLLSAVTGHEHQTNTTYAEWRLERDASELRRAATRLYDLLPASGPINTRDPFISLVLRHGADPNASTSVGMAWGNSGHQVTVERIADGRVYFRNPWGAQPEIAAGTMLTDPPRRMEDPLRGMASMTVEDFRERLQGAVVPT